MTKKVIQSCFLIIFLLCFFALYTNSISLKVRNNQETKPDKESGKLLYLKNPSFLVVGYNFLLGNPKMTPSSGKLIDPGFASDIFKLTYNEKQTSGDFIFSYPDGFSLQVTQICQANFSSKTIRNKSELQKSIEASLGISGSSGVYAGSLNAEYKDMSKSMTENDKMFMMNEAECSIYKTHVNQYSPPPLSEEFLRGLKTIEGKNWVDANKEYRAFLDSFGTHYIKDTLMGSRYTYILETTNTKYTQMLERGVNIAAKAEYSAVSSLSVNTSLKANNNSNEEFEKNISNKYVTSLGAPMPGSLEMSAWFESTKEDPMPIFYSISPISQLLSISSIKERLRAAGLNPESLISGLESAVQGLIKEIAQSNIAGADVSAVISSIKTYNTDFSDDGSGNVYFLDRHIIMCPDYEALTSWRLVRGDKQIKYEYKCIKSDSISKTCTEYSTDPQDAGSANFMDRHNVNCPNGVMKGFQFLRNGNRMFFKYSCCNLSVSLSCNQIETAKTPSGDFSTFFLDRQKIDIPAGRAIAQFKLNSDGSNYFYSLRVCDVNRSNDVPADSPAAPVSPVSPFSPVAPATAVISTRTANTNWNDAGQGNIFFLDRQEVICGPNEGISQFVLAREGNNIRYNYTCSKSQIITTSCEQKSTPLNDTDSNPSNSAHFLDRHDMICNANSVIQRFKLERNNNRINYSYTCCKTLNTGICNARTSAPSSNGSRETFYLDRQNVVAQANTAFSRIKLNTQGDNFTYSTSECFIN